MLKTELQGLNMEEVLTPPVRQRKTRHYLFTGTPDDKITIPVCGTFDNNVVATRRLKNVTCPDCLDRLIALSAAENYRDALRIVSEPIDFPEEPIEEIMQERFNNQPTRRAEEHMRVRTLLRNKELEKVLDIPKNIIGTHRTTFYRTIIEIGLIHGPQSREKVGEPVEEVLDELRSLAASLRA